MPAIDGIAVFDDKISVVTTIPCCICNRTHQFTLNTIKLNRWIQGEKIQDVFPELSIEDREILITGTCDPCFKEMFPPEE